MIKAAKILVDEMMGQQMNKPRCDLPNVVAMPSRRAKTKMAQEGKSSEQNQQSSEHDNKTSVVEATTTTKTVEDFLKRKEKALHLRHANSSPPPQLLLDNTRDERLLMRFVRTL